MRHEDDGTMVDDHTRPRSAPDSARDSARGGGGTPLAGTWKLDEHARTLDPEDGPPGGARSLAGTWKLDDGHQTHAHVEREDAAERARVVHGSTLRLPEEAVTQPEPGDGDEASGAGLGETWVPRRGDGQGAGEWPPITPGNRFELGKLLGQGAEGEVFVARDRDLGRRVAYKRLKERFDVSARTLERFATEARLMSQLDHPSVVPVYVLEATPEGTPAYAMKLVRGKSVDKLIAAARECHASRRPLPPELDLPARLEMFARVCDAVAYAHAAGVLHRDLKPSNIMVGRFHEVYIMDWGIARVIAAPAEGEEHEVDLGPLPGPEPEGAIIGTPLYMSPEQARGENASLDFRSDQASLGLILYELVTLRPPRQGETLEAMLEEARTGLRKRPRGTGRRKHVHRELRAIIRKATAVDRERRYPSVAALGEDVRRYMRGEAVLAAPDTPLRRLRRWMGRSAAFTALVLLAVAGAALFVGWLWGDAPDTPAGEDPPEVVWLKATAADAMALDARLQAVETALEGLAAAASHALLHGREDEAPELAETAESDAEVPPLGAAEGPKVVPRLMAGSDADEIQAAPTLARLRNLTPRMARTYQGQGRAWRRTDLSSRPGKAPAQSGTDANAAVPTHGRDQVASIVRLHLGTAKGSYTVFPADDDLPANFDPRRQVWYRGVQQLGELDQALWHLPAFDRAHDHWLVAASRALLGADGEVLGVAAVEIGAEPLAAFLARIVADRGYASAALLDAEGRVVVEPTSFQRGGTSSRIGTPYPVAEVVRAVATGPAGTLRDPADPDAALIVFQRLPSTEWTLVVSAPLDGRP